MLDVFHFDIIFCVPSICSVAYFVQLDGQVEVPQGQNKWEVEEEVEPVSLRRKLPCFEDHAAELDQVHEKGVENPEEGEEGPVGVVVVEEVDDESLQVGGHIQ